ncbi:MAG: T9SS type A sorting domain-containing protein, partial [Sphingobacteriia bacterium]|nr:T9SS type A sorting domain-containing protein [Sphingobacteriia bacterium]
GFNVYRNTVKINQTLITDTEYLDTDLSIGTYTYYVTAVYDIGESGGSNQVTEIITSIYEPAVQAFNIYPNPATDAVTIIGNAQFKQVRIVNYTGQVVYQNVVNNSETTISTRDLSSGVYILQVETQEGWSSRKLMIK